MIESELRVILTENGKGEVWLNGEPLKRVTAVSIKASVDHPATACVEILPDVVTFHGVTEYEERFYWDMPSLRIEQKALAEAVHASLTPEFININRFNRACDRAWFRLQGR